jgi:hypothetical protein
LKSNPEEKKKKRKKSQSDAKKDKGLFVIETNPI